MEFHCQTYFISSSAHTILFYLALCLTGGEGGCLPCRGHMSDRWSLDLSVKASLPRFSCTPTDFVCPLLLRVDFEVRPKPVDTVAIVPVPLSRDCSKACYTSKRNKTNQ